VRAWASVGERGLARGYDERDRVNASEIAACYHTRANSRTTQRRLLRASPLPGLLSPICVGPIEDNAHSSRRLSFRRPQRRGLAALLRRQLAPAPPSSHSLPASPAGQHAKGESKRGEGEEETAQPLSTVTIASAESTRRRRSTHSHSHAPFLATRSRSFVVSRWVRE